MNTLRQQIEEVAKHANLTTEVATQLQRFFLDVATQEEKDKLDNWMLESEANDRLFDLLLELNAEGTGAGGMRLLTKLAKKPQKRRRALMALGIVIAAGVIALVVDHFVPSNPLKKLIYGEAGRNYYTDTVEAGNTTRIILLPDSTRVELSPHSKLGYESNFLLYSRKVRLWGTATLDVKTDIIGPLEITTDLFGLTIAEGKITLRNGEIVTEGNNIDKH